MSGFTIQNTGLSYTEELSGVRLIESEDCHIFNNHFINTTYGVYLENSKNCHIKNNNFEGLTKDEVSGGNGIHIWYGSNHFITDNKIHKHRDGIYLEFSTNNRIEKNTVENNLRYGLHFMSSSLTQCQKNMFKNNEAGVAIMYSKNIRMENNYFSENGGSSSYGLLLKEVFDSQIKNNNFTENTAALYMEGTNRSQFENNLISSNGWALKIMGSCEANEFTHNDFIANTFDISTNTNQNWNTFKNNYWSQYDGYDLNRDGIRDKPYRPVSLSSLILAQVDSSYILINSFFFTLIDQIERALPILIPELLKDESPLMKPLNRGAKL